MLVNGFAVKTEIIDRSEDVSLESSMQSQPASALKGHQFAGLVLTLSCSLVVAFT